MQYEKQADMQIHTFVIKSFKYAGPHCT